MKILDAICEIPGLNIEGRRKVHKRGYKCHSYGLEKDIILAKWVSEVCQKLVDKNNISTEDIGIIINSSIYSGGTLISERETWGPGLSYAIHKSLDAKNAFVFDMYCEEWGTTLQIANDFLVDSSQKYALIIYSEKASKYIANQNNGFCLIDGVGVLLIESLEDSDNKIENSYYHVNCDIVKNAEIHFIPNTDINNDKIKFSVDWYYSSEIVDLINYGLTELIDKCDDKEKIFVEQWFPDHYTENKVKLNPESLFLGRFSIPWQLQNSLRSKEFDFSSSSFISFNPFTSRYSLLKIN